VILSGPRLHGLAGDEATHRAFVLVSTKPAHAAGSDIAATRGIFVRTVRPGFWSQSRTISPGSILGLNLALSTSSRRCFALQLETAQSDSVRAFCMTASCLQAKMPP